MKRLKSQKCPQNSLLPSNVVARIKLPDLLCYQLAVFFPKPRYKFCQINPNNLTWIMSLAAWKLNGEHGSTHLESQIFGNRCRKTLHYRWTGTVEQDHFLLPIAISTNIFGNASLAVNRFWVWITIYVCLCKWHICNIVNTSQISVNPFLFLYKNEYFPVPIDLVNNLWDIPGSM